MHKRFLVVLLAVVIAGGLIPAAVGAQATAPEDTARRPVSVSGDSAFINRARALAEQGAELGYAVPQVWLGLMYAKGKGVPQNYAEAVKWYRKAASQGNASAQYLLGVMYANGHGVPQDDAEAVKWYRLAAEQGDANGQDSLGVAYASGRGAPRDHAEAVKWFRKAAAQGDTAAQKNLDAAQKYHGLMLAEQGFADAQRAGTDEALVAFITKYDSSPLVPSAIAKLKDYIKVPEGQVVRLGVSGGSSSSSNGETYTCALDMSVFSTLPVIRCRERAEVGPRMYCKPGTASLEFQSWTSFESYLAKGAAELTEGGLVFRPGATVLMRR